MSALQSTAESWYQLPSARLIISQAWRSFEPRPPHRMVFAYFFARRFLRNWERVGVCVSSPTGKRKSASPMSARIATMYRRSRFCGKPNWWLPSTLNLNCGYPIAFRRLWIQRK